MVWTRPGWPIRSGHLFSNMMGMLVPAGKVAMFQATDTMVEFIRDPAYVRLIAGPVGSGKSVCCSHELVRLALAQAPNKDGVRKSRTAIIRNTADQLRTTTAKTFMDWFPSGVWGTYKTSERTYYMRFTLPDKTKIDAEFMMLPLDSPDDVRKVLSLELTFAWLNEVREIRPEIIDGILMRLRRYPSRKDGGPTRSCAILDTNMPDMDTWHFRQMEEPPENWSVFIQPPAILGFDEFYNQEGHEPDEADAATDPRGNHWWINPQADNVDNLDPLYYPSIIPGKTEDFISVYLRCRYGRSLAGLPVYENTFSPDFHIAEEPFTALRSESYPLIIGLDFGRTPSAAICQRNARGQLVVLDELSSENMGIESFLSQKLQLRLSESDFIGCSAVIAPDPAGWAKQQIGEVSPVDVVKKAGFSVAKPSTNDPERRIEAVERLLLDHIDGKPALIINPGCGKLIKGFRYGYKYKLNKNGTQENKPLKDEWSHIHDSLQYACLIAQTNPAGGAFGHHQRRSVSVANASGWT